MTQVMVLGAGGHIGAALCHELAQNYAVTAVVRDDRPRRNLAGLDLRYRYEDLDDADFEALFSGMDWVIDAAAPYPMALDTPAQQLRSWFERYERMLAALATKQTVFLHVDTFVNLPTDGASSSIGLTVVSRSHPYFVTKKRISTIVSKSLPGAVRLFPSACIGPYDARPSEQNLIALLSQDAFPITPRQDINLVDVRDVARSVKGILNSDRPPSSNIPLFGHRISVHDLAKMVSSIAGSRIPLEIPAPKALAGAAMLSLESFARLSDRHLPIGLLALLTMSDYKRPETDRDYLPLEKSIRDTLAWSLQATGD